MSDRGRRWLGWGGGALIVALFVVPKLFQHATLQTGDLDTGNYSNLAWAIFHGEGFRGSVLGRHHLGEHFSPIMVLIGLIYLLWSDAYVLMLLQGLSVAVAILLTLKIAQGRLSPLPFRARVRVRGDAGASDRVDSAIDAQQDLSPPPHPGPLPQGERGTTVIAACVLFVLLVLYPPMLAAWKTQFQPIELGMPLIALAILLLHARHDACMGVVVLLLLMTRESAPLAVVGLAIYAAFAIKRLRIASVLTLVAVIWAAIIFGWVMPHFRAGEHWAHERWFDPVQMWDLKAKYLAVVFFGLGPLPYLTREGRFLALAAVPGVLLNLSVARETQLTFVGHYDAQIAPFLMAAAALGMVSSLAQWSPSRSRLVIAGTSVALAIAAFSIAGTRTPFECLVRWWPDQKSLAAAREARDVAQKYSTAPALSATSRLGPQVCNRPDYMAMRCGTTSESWVHWASDRLEPGTILLLPTEQLDDEVAERDLVHRSGRAERVYEGKFIEAWQWPGDAPPAGTQDANRYVRSGIGKPATKRSRAQ